MFLCNDRHRRATRVSDEAKVKKKKITDLKQHNTTESSLITSRKLISIENEIRCKIFTMNKFFLKIIE